MASHTQCYTTTPQRPFDEDLRAKIGNQADSQIGNDEDNEEEEDNRLFPPLVVSRRC